MAGFARFLAAFVNTATNYIHHTYGLAESSLYCWFYSLKISVSFLFFKFFLIPSCSYVRGSEQLESPRITLVNVHILSSHHLCNLSFLKGNLVHSYNKLMLNCCKNFSADSIFGWNFPRTTILEWWRHKATTSVTAARKQKFFCLD